MTKEVKRSYLEINSLHELKESPQLSKDYSLDLCEPNDFQLNKFFYKNIGESHMWINRLIWTENQFVLINSKNNLEMVLGILLIH